MFWTRHRITGFADVWVRFELGFPRGGVVGPFGFSFGGIFMTSNQFRKLALSFPGTEERAHMDHPDFRVEGKIFATLHYPDDTRGMVKLFPDQQAELMRTDPDAFAPAAGKWGLKGATLVNLKAAKKEKLREALATAWENAAPKKKAKGIPAGSNKKKKTAKRK
jgi:hypothetical protein